MKKLIFWFFITITWLSQTNSSCSVAFAWDMHDTLMRRFVSTSFDYLTVEKKILIKKIYKGIRQGSFNERMINIIYAWNPQILTVGKQMAGVYYPTGGIIELIKELYQMGHKHYIAANISAHELRQLKKHFPLFFIYFTDEQTVDFTVSRPIKKPQLEYFINFQNKFNPQRTDTIIFIDEKQKNIDSANKAGMRGIRFYTVDKLRHELQQLGIIRKL